MILSDYQYKLNIFLSISSFLLDKVGLKNYVLLCFSTWIELTITTMDLINVMVVFSDSKLCLS